MPRRNVPQTAVSVEKLGLFTALISVVVQAVGSHVKTCMKAMMMMMMMMMIMIMMMMTMMMKSRSQEKGSAS